MEESNIDLEAEGDEAELEGLIGASPAVRSISLLSHLYSRVTSSNRAVPFLFISPTTVPSLFLYSTVPISYPITVCYSDEAWGLDTLVEMPTWRRRSPALSVQARSLWLPETSAGASVITSASGGSFGTREWANELWGGDTIRRLGFSAGSAVTVTAGETIQRWGLSVSDRNCTAVAEDPNRTIRGFCGRNVTNELLKDHIDAIHAASLECSHHAIAAQRMLSAGASSVTDEVMSAIHAASLECGYHAIAAKRMLSAGVGNVTDEGMAAINAWVNCVDPGNAAQRMLSASAGNVTNERLIRLLQKEIEDRMASIRDALARAISADAAQRRLPAGGGNVNNERVMRFLQEEVEHHMAAIHHALARANATSELLDPTRARVPKEEGEVTKHVIYERPSEDAAPVAEHGGAVVAAVHDIHGGHDTAREVERQLLELRQASDDMALAARSQGEQLDYILRHVESAYNYIQGGGNQLGRIRKWLCVGTTLHLLLALIIVLSIVLPILLKCNSPKNVRWIKMTIYWYF